MWCSKRTLTNSVLAIVYVHVSVHMYDCDSKTCTCISTYV